jgi:CheY-like chemotaxis protein
MQGEAGEDRGRGLAILKAEELALIVLDYLLPRSTGLEVLAEIQATRPPCPQS